MAKIRKDNRVNKNNASVIHNEKRHLIFLCSHVNQIKIPTIKEQPIGKTENNLLFIIEPHSVFLEFLSCTFKYKCLFWKKS